MKYLSDRNKAKKMLSKVIGGAIGIFLFLAFVFWEGLFNLL
jgi:hypothetical protein